MLKGKNRKIKKPKLENFSSNSKFNIFFRIFADSKWKHSWINKIVIKYEFGINEIFFIINKKIGYNGGIKIFGTNTPFTSLELNILFSSKL